LDSEPNFNRIDESVVFEKNFVSEGYFLKQASKKFNISANVAQKIMSSIIVSGKTKNRPKKLNLGLKFRYQQKCLPGWSWAETGFQGDGAKYYFNLKCLDVMKAYKEAYPFVFEMLANVSGYEAIELDSVMLDKTAE